MPAHEDWEAVSAEFVAGSTSAAKMSPEAGEGEEDDGEDGVALLLEPPGLRRLFSGCGCGPEEAPPSGEEVAPGFGGASWS